MISPLRYPGGKSRKSVQEKILRYAPKVIEEYREPFVGGGGIFFALDNEVPPVRWINDINCDLMAVYLALRDNSDEFISKCRSINPEQSWEDKTYPKAGSSGKQYNARLKAAFDQLIKDRENDPAFSYFFVNRTVWGGRVNYDMPSRLYFSNPSGWNITVTNRLQCAADLLKGTIITCGNYKQLLAQPSEYNNVWIYCDPPYVVDTEAISSSKLYKYGFTKQDHIALRDDILDSHHKVCISYDDDPDGMIRELYRGFYIHELEWTYSGTSSSKNASKTKKKGKELLITNYRQTHKRHRAIFDETI